MPATIGLRTALALRAAFGLAAALVVGCGLDPVSDFPPDAAPANAMGVTDAMGMTDAGSQDVLPTDASPVDASPVDVGHLDAGAFADAAAPDAVVADASRIDAGTWGPCSVAGVAGVCIDTALCDGDRLSTAGLCPGPAEIQCCTPRGSTFMCDATDHPQPNTGAFETAGSGGCPQAMLRVANFCIDRYEAILVEVQTNGSTTSWSPYQHPGNRRVRALSVAGAVPQGYIDGRSAAAACLEAGKRLCTDAEWLRACRGPSSRIYPYGDTRQPGVCNDARARHPAVELFPNEPNPFARIQNACINQLPDSLDRTGVNSNCATAEGALDMMGNLHEWTADPTGTFRGGFYVDTYRNGEGCLYRTTAHSTGHWDYSTGFRCCATP